jgi:very-long-chain enoyl-CoA reductase
LVEIAAKRVRAELRAMSSLTITATGKSTLLRGFPVSLKLEKPADAATIADVKAALAAKFPQVRSSY